MATRKKMKRTRYMFTIMRALLMCTLAMLIVVSAISFGVTTGVLRSSTLASTKLLISQIDEELNAYINYVNNMSDFILADSLVQEFCTLPDNSKKIQSSKDSFIKEIGSVISQRNDIIGVYVFGTNGHIMSNREDFVRNEYFDYESAEWYKNGISSTKGYISPSHVQSLVKNEYKWVISYSRAIVQNNEIVGVLLIDLNYSNIENVCSTSSLASDRGYIFVVDDVGEIIYHPQQQLIYAKIKTEILSTIKASESDQINYDDKIYNIVQSQNSPWKTVGVVNESALTDDSYLIWLYLGLALVLSIIVLFVSYFLSKRVTEPVNQLKDTMRLVEQGDFNVRSEVTANNELFDLSNNFNAMTDRIKALMEQNTKDSEEKRLIELRALYAQINPHFLYNTLDSIIWMAEANGQEDIVEMTSNLAKLFRASISVSEELVPLSSEIEHVKSYLSIQKVRYKDKLDFKIDVSSDLLSRKVVRLLLQPLVENAIYHGIKPKSTCGIVRITANESSDVLFIKVFDSGVGMSEEQINAIMKAPQKSIIDKKSGDNIGFANVDSRIKLMFGKNYGLSLESEFGSFTEITVRLPVLR